MRRHSFLLAAAIITIGAILVALPVGGQQQPAAGDEPPLPTDRIEIAVDAPEAQTYRIGIPDLLGVAPHNAQSVAVLRNDFTLMPGYAVIDQRGVRHDTTAEANGINQSAWAALHANGVINGQIGGSGNNLTADMRFFQVSRPSQAALTKRYTGTPEQLRAHMNDFANEVLRTITGTPGPFGTRITFATRRGPGQKQVFVSEMDGYNPTRVSGEQGVNMLPTFGPGGAVWFSRLTQTGMYITHTSARDRRIVGGTGLNMGASICNNKIFFTSSRDGNSEIYSASLDGTNVRRLTNNSAIDVSPSCGPTGKIAFVSQRHGSPQIFTMDADGSNQRRVTFRGTHNQTPSWCPLPGRQLLAFTGRDNTLDIFTIDLATNEYVRLTQAQGMNKDPAWSPDCRLIAFVSDRRSGAGVYLASTQGFNQNRVVSMPAETVRWEHLPPRTP